MKRTPGVDPGRKEMLSAVSSSVTIRSTTAVMEGGASSLRHHTQHGAVGQAYACGRE